MDSSFKPVSPERAEEIERALRAARSSKVGVQIDRQTGEFLGTAPLNTADPEKVSMIGKFDTHYGRSTERSVEA